MRPQVLAALGIGAAIVANELRGLWRRRARVVTVVPPISRPDTRSALPASDALVDEDRAPRAAQEEVAAAEAAQESAVPFWDFGAEPRPAVRDMDGRARFLCACCQLPTFPDGIVPGEPSCVVCDFEDPIARDGGYRVPEDDRRAEGSRARERFQAFESVITPEERASYAGGLSAAEIRMRRELRETLAYLMVDDRPDASERWARADALTVALRESERRRVEELGGSDSSGVSGDDAGSDAGDDTSPQGR